jgi:hypothetical protein
MTLSTMDLTLTERLSISTCNPPSACGASMVAALPSATTLTRVTAGQTSATWRASIGSMLMLIASAIPGLLYWVVTFTTITLPTALFTLFSTSLTFTMNFTTL